MIDTITLFTFRNPTFKSLPSFKQIYSLIEFVVFPLSEIYISLRPVVNALAFAEGGGGGLADVGAAVLVLFLQEVVGG